MRETLQQGHADGMCGLYAILNFLTRVKGGGWERSSDSLWYLLDACRHYGWLTPHNLTQGFEDFQLKAILDLQIENYRMDFESLRLGDLKKSLGLGSFFEIATRVLNKDGSIIASATRRNHWVLVTNEYGVMSTIDSAKSDDPVQILNVGTTAFSPLYGVVVIPRRRPIVAVTL